MGLDITWYRGLKKVENVVFDGDGEPTNVEYYFRPYVNSDFPGRESPLEHREIYTYEEADAGPYIGYGRYNHWRDWLAKIAGWPLKSYHQYGKDWPSHCVDCWNGETGPFSELINFSDCEGAIGHVVAAKLAKDFAEFDDRAKAADARNFYEHYKQWRLVFVMASDNGAVSFH